PSPRRLAARLRQRVATLLATTYRDFNDCHATEKLQEVEGLALSRPTVRRLRQALGRPAKHRRRPRQYRARREPRARMGALVQPRRPAASNGPPRAPVAAPAGSPRQRAAFVRHRPAGGRQRFPAGFPRRPEPPLRPAAGAPPARLAAAAPRAAPAPGLSLRPP